MTEPKKRGGWSNPASAANGAKSAESDASGRPPTQAIIRDGDGIMISQVYADGSYVDLGRGKVTIRKRGHGRVIAIAQEDGSEIRIIRP